MWWRADGGDEFVVILQETNVDNTGIVAEKLRAALKAGLPAVAGLGASIGCATLQPNMSATSPRIGRSRHVPPETSPRQTIILGSRLHDSLLPNRSTPAARSGHGEARDRVNG